jgi:hypothetical protein
VAKEALGGRDREGRRLLLVEGATRHDDAALLTDLDAALDDDCDTSFAALTAQRQCSSTPFKDGPLGARRDEHARHLPFAKRR